MKRKPDELCYWGPFLLRRYLLTLKGEKQNKDEEVKPDFLKTHVSNKTRIGV